MIQTQTLAIDETTRLELQRISELIAKYRNDPSRLEGLIAAHDEIVKSATTKPYEGT